MGECKRLSAGPRSGGQHKLHYTAIDMVNKRVKEYTSTDIERKQEANDLKVQTCVEKLESKGYIATDIWREIRG